MKRLILLVIILGIALTLTGCGNNNDNSNLVPDGTIKTELTVWGMTCGSCVHRITSAMSGIDGIIDIVVDLSSEKVTIVHDEELDIEIIKEAIIAKGYNIP